MRGAGRRSAGQGCRAGRKRQEQPRWARCARDREGTRGAPGKRTRDGRTPGSRQQGARGSRASGQRAGEGKWPLVHGVTGIPRQEIGMVGRCRPTCHPTVSATTLPCGRDGVPTPTGVPGCAAAGARAAAPAGRWGGLGSTGREGRGAQEGIGEDRGGRGKHGSWQERPGWWRDGRRGKACHGEGRRRQSRSCRRPGLIFGEGWRGWRWQSEKARSPGS